MGDSSTKSGWRATATYLTYRGLGAIIGRLPEPVAKGVVEGVVRTMAQGRSNGLIMNERHLRRVLASECVDGVRPDDDLVRRWSRRSYSEYGRYWLEGARLPYVAPDLVRERMSFDQDGEKIVREAAATGRGVIIALPHIGTWEWGGAWLALEGMPLTSIVERIEPEKLLEWFANQRSHMGLTTVPLGEGSSAVMLKVLREGGVVGLVCDRDILGNGIEVEFFGERTTMPGGPATLALRTGAVLLPLAIYSGPGDWHTAAVHPPLDTVRQGSLRADVQRLTQELATCFEEFVVRHPEQWHLYQSNWPSDHEVAS